jgi:hypothetical protein
MCYGLSIFHKSHRERGRHGSIRSEDGLLDLKLALPAPWAEGAMRPIPNNSSPAGMQPALRMHVFM